MLAEWWIILRKEETSMNYTKPEVVVLGKASVVIESQNKSNSATDFAHTPPDSTGPAYDLDE